jgi:hypothetical protein
MMPNTDTLPIITTSERRAFKRCVYRWWWEYRQGLRPREINSKLWFGIGIHEALALYYRPGTKRDMSYIDRFRDFCEHDEISKVIRTRPSTEEFDAESAWVDAVELGTSMLTGYHEYYGGDPDWEVIYTEEPFQILIPVDPLDKRNAENIAVFTSTFDGVYRDKHDRNRIKLMEHKTAQTISTDHLPLDEQGGSYFAVADHILHDKGILGKNEHITEITYNFLRKSLPDTRPRDADGYATNKPLKEDYITAFETAGIAMPVRGKLDDLAEHARKHGITVLGQRSKVQPAPLFVREQCIRTPRERLTQIARLSADVTAMNMYRDGALELTKNPTHDCSWDCPFFNMCQLHEMQSDWEEFRDAVFIVRNPYDRYKLLKSAADVV